MDRKADMSIDIIVKVTIAVLILVIIVFLIGKQAGWFNTSTDCVSKGASCRPGDACPDGQQEVPDGVCPIAGDVCCRFV